MLCRTIRTTSGQGSAALSSSQMMRVIALACRPPDSSHSPVHCTYADFCWRRPILTYGNQGCRKAGVKPNKHGIVCEQGTTPVLLPNEPNLGFAPIRLQMAAANEHISGESRVNYSKLVTVEHNVKVFFIGRVSFDDWPIVQSAVDHCWEAKNRDKTHHSHHGSRRPKK